MSYKSILVHTDPYPSNVAGLRCAADLADAFQATLLGLAAETLGPLGISAGGGYEASEAAWITTQRELVAENLKLAQASFTQEVGTRPHEWRTAWSAPTEAMAQMARAADLIVVGGDRATRFQFDPNRAVDAGRLIMTAGRPILLCPPHAERLSPRSALIAWKDTRESRRAVLDALPLLKRAEDVMILEVVGDADSGRETSGLLDVVSALARHGVKAQSQLVVKRVSSSETLMDHAEAMDAGLIVAGGYGHSRVGEWVFGGVTKSLLKQDRRFVLFSH